MEERTSVKGIPDVGRPSASDVTRLLVLSHIHRKGGKSAEDISALLNISRKTAHRYLGDLRRKGLVRITINGDDGKYRYSCNPERDDLIQDLSESLARIMSLGNMEGDGS